MRRKLMVGWMLLCVGLSAMGVGWWMEGRALAAPAGVESTSDGLIRIHVIANSDSPEDQAVKLQVRDAVLAELGQRLAGAATVADARAVIEGALSDLEGVAGQALTGAGFTYGARAEFGRFSFPGKTYGDVYLPAGEYQALRIVLGEGKGANFWCIVFPDFCYKLKDVRRPVGGRVSPGGGSRTDRW